MSYREVRVFEVREALRLWLRGEGVRSIERVKQLAARHEADIFFSHDMDAWKAYKHAPDFYEG